MTGYWVVFCLLACGELLVRVNAEVATAETCDIDNNNCVNGGQCEAGNDHNFCTCATGVTGDLCQSITDCEAGGRYEKCKTGGGNCTFSGGQATCVCEPDKQYDTKSGQCRNTCEQEIDCTNGMKCIIEEGVGFCQCVPGLSGDKCENIDECQTGKFKNCNSNTGGRCEFLIDKPVCECGPGKGFDTNLEVCRETCVDDSYCSNGMECQIKDDVGHCQCVPGLSGDKCEIIADCATGKFKNCGTDSGGQCTFLFDKPVCECGPGKGFDTLLEVCRDTCEQNRDCGNGMDCWIKDDVGHCQCVDGLSGDKCEIIEECETGKFKHCNTVNGGQCKFVNLKPVCECEDGKGFDSNLGICRDTCEQASDCSNGMECKIEEDVGHCQCVPGLSGDKCDIIDECVTGIFKNCNTDKGGQCRFVDMKSVCECENGKEFDTILEICRDSCSSNPCKNEGVCTVINSTDYLCECKQPFSGNHCERHPCHSNPCLNDGICIAVENNYGCVCDEPFYGRHCENDPCTPSPCKNDGLCEVVGIGFKCTCKASYFGKQCKVGEITTNTYGTCQSNADCRNGGICDRDGPGYFCMCRKPFIGDRCELDVCNSVSFECRSKGTECVRQGTIGVCKCPMGKKMSLFNYCEDICTYETCVHGTCELTGYNFSQYVCNCYEGYYGRHCENAEVMQYAPAISILVILASGIVLFLITSIVAGCWVKKLRKKIAENTKQTGQP